jgi:hypothetical protein
MNRPVLFLDFDGPLFPERAIRHGPSMALYPGDLTFHPFIDYWEMDETSVRQMNSLYDIYQFDTVVSSSWRNYCDREQIEELFKVNGLSLHLHEEWATPRKMSSYRVNEISWWLDEFTERRDGDIFVSPSHIILDDPWSGNSLEGSAWKDFALQEPFMVDPDVGIDTTCYRNMLAVVRSWRDDYISREYVRMFPKRDWNGIIDKFLDSED